MPAEGLGRRVHCWSHAVCKGALCGTLFDACCYFVLQSIAINSDVVYLHFYFRVLWR